MLRSAGVTVVINVKRRVLDKVSAATGALVTLLHHRCCASACTPEQQLRTDGVMQQELPLLKESTRHAPALFNEQP